MPTFDALRKNEIVLLPAFPLKTDPHAVYDMPVLPYPPYLVPYRDPVFGRQVLRISGDAGTAATFRDTGGALTWSKDSGPHYTRDNPWSRDGKYLALENVGTSGGVVYGGAPSNLLLDGVTYLPALPFPADYVKGDDKWYPSFQYPHARVNIPPSPNNTTLELFDLVADVRLMSMALPRASGMGPSKAQLTRDGRYAVLVNAASSSSVTGFYLVDLVAQTTGPLVTILPLPNGGVGQPTASVVSAVGNVSLTPNGNYVVVSYSGDYQQVYSVNKSTLVATLMTYANTIPTGYGTAADGWTYPLSHHDVGLDAFGTEILVGTEAGGQHGNVDVPTGQTMGTVVKVDPATGAYTSLTVGVNESPSHHTSLQNFDRPGWATVSFYINRGLVMQGELANIALDGSHAVERLCHAHSATSGCYRCEEHPVPHYNGRRVCFRSTWTRKAVNPAGSQGIRQAYVVSAPLSP